MIANMWMYLFPIIVLGRENAKIDLYSGLLIILIDFAMLSCNYFMDSINSKKIIN